MNWFYLILLVNLVIYSQVHAQTLGEDYDRRERTIDPFGDTSDYYGRREKRINNIIRRIRKGDRTVLRLATHDTLEAVHDELVRLSYYLYDIQQGDTNLLKNRSYKDLKIIFLHISKIRNNKKYFTILGKKKAIPAFLSGLENEDSKVQFECVRILTDYTDRLELDAHTKNRIHNKIIQIREIKYFLDIDSYYFILGKVEKEWMSKTYKQVIQGENIYKGNWTLNQFITYHYVKLIAGRISTARFLDPFVLTIQNFSSHLFPKIMFLINR